MPYTNAVGRVLRDSTPSQKWVDPTTPGGNVTGTSANETLTGGAGQVLTGGPGDDIYGMTGPATIVELPGEGIDSQSVWGSGSLQPNVENLVMNGGYGWFGFGNELDNIIRGTGGSQQIDGKAGNDVLFGGAGADLFVVAKGQGSDLILDFTTGSDRIQLAGYGLHSFDEVKAVARQVGADTVLALSEGTTLVLAGVTATSLVAKDFLYDLDLSHFTRTFSEEFDSLSLAVNGGTWRTWYGHNASSELNSRYHNDEAQVYVDPDFRGTSNAPLGLNPFSVEDGVLTITAAPTTAAQAAVLGGHAYTSGLLTTETTFSQTYGYFEIRAALPETQGMWPAFWLLPADGSWPPEIDVFEMLGKDPDTIYFTAHRQENGQHLSSGGQFRIDTSGFHTYGVDWAPDFITYYIDGTQIGKVPTPTSMHTPMYMLANLAVGGSWGGAPDATTGVGRMEIDYIHAYAHNPAGTTHDATPGSVAANKDGSPAVPIICYVSDDQTAPGKAAPAGASEPAPATSSDLATGASHGEDWILVDDAFIQPAWPADPVTGATAGEPGRDAAYMITLSPEDTITFTALDAVASDALPGPAEPRHAVDIHDDAFLPLFTDPTAAGLDASWDAPWDNGSMAGDRMPVSAMGLVGLESDAHYMSLATIPGEWMHGAFEALSPPGVPDWLH